MFDAPHIPQHDSIRGRGAAHNPPNRFERLRVLPDPDLALAHDEDFLRQLHHPATHYLKDASRTIIATNDSPDINFSASINPYRGCTHGCVYCYARPTHEYLGFSPGLDFETRILVKHDAPALLRTELASKRWQPQTIGMSGVTDCYQPIERQLRLTRGCLEVLADFRNPVCVITKNHLVTRDIDLLSTLARHEASRVYISITTLDPALTRIMEPRTSVPRDRLKTIRELAAAGIPVGVLVCPVIPGLTDHEMPAILKAAADAGALTAGYEIIRLPYALKELFTDFLRRHFPDRAAKILNRIRHLRGGNLYDASFGKRMSGTGLWADQIRAVYTLARNRHHLTNRITPLSAAHFRVPSRAGDQLPLFGA